MAQAPKQLQDLIQKMVDEDASEDDIREVIAHAKAQPPTFWEKHPTMAAVGRSFADALPGIGGVLGGMVAASAGGLPALGGAALGVGIGRGARDLITEATGLEPKTSPESKALRIGGDTALAAVVPGATEAALNPINTIKQLEPEISGTLKGGIRLRVPGLTKGVSAAEKPILTRPSWQAETMTPNPLRATEPTPAAAPKPAPMSRAQQLEGIPGPSAVRVMGDPKAAITESIQNNTNPDLQPEGVARIMGRADQMGRQSINTMRGAGMDVPETGLRTRADIDRLVASKPTGAPPRPTPAAGGSPFEEALMSMQSEGEAVMPGQSTPTVSAPGFKTGGSLESLAVPASKSSRAARSAINPNMTPGDEAAYFAIKKANPTASPEQIVQELLKRRSAASQSYRALGGRPE